MNTFSSFYSTPNPLDSITFASLVHHHKMTPQQALASLYGTKTSQTTKKRDETDKATKKREEASIKREEASVRRKEKKERKRVADVAAVAAEIQMKLRKSVPGNIMNIPELKTTTRPSTEVALTGLQKKMWEESKKHEPKKYKTLPCEHLSGIRSPQCKYKHRPLRCPFYHNEKQKQIMKDILKITKSTKTTKPKDSSTA